MPSQPPSKPVMSREELSLWVARRLGEPWNPVELTEDNYNDAIDDALQWFTSKKGIQKYTRIAINAGQNEYLLDDDVDTVIGSLRLVRYLTFLRLLRFDNVDLTSAKEDPQKS